MSFAFVVRPRARSERTGTSEARSTHKRRFGLAWLAPVWIAGVLGFAALGPGCSSYSSDLFVEDDGSVEPSSVRFAHDGVLELQPREVVTIDIVTDAGAQVGLLLLGEAFDASIDKTTVRADASGHASLELRAPSQPSTFRLRAQVGDQASAELGVAVSDGGFGKVSVHPEYDGVREIDGWVASVTVGTSCDAVLAGLPADPPGSLVASSAANADPVVASVPVGPAVVVMVRSGAVVAGCKMTTLEAAGETSDLTVTVLDRPMVLGSAELDVTLGFTTAAPEYGELLATSTDLVASTAFPPGQPASGILLDAIAAELTEDADIVALGVLRQSDGLDATVESALAGYHPFDTCAALGAAGADLATTQATTESSYITGRLTGDASNPGAPLFELAGFGEAGPAELGVPASVSMSWSSTPGDGLVISGAVPFSPSLYAAFWMNAAAAEAAGSNATVVDAIRAEIDCAEVAALIGPLPTCDTTCLEATCSGALDARWKAGALAADQGGFPEGLIKITVSGNATVDISAVPVTLEGSWVGAMQGFDQAAPASGSATGQKPPPG